MLRLLDRPVVIRYIVIYYCAFMCLIMKSKQTYNL